MYFQSFNFSLKLLLDMSTHDSAASTNMERRKEIGGKIERFILKILALVLTLIETGGTNGEWVVDLATTHVQSTFLINHTCLLRVYQT